MDRVECLISHGWTVVKQQVTHDQSVSLGVPDDRRLDHRAIDRC
jgi:hypothetical protein